MQLKPNEHVTVMGGTGSGKTVFAISQALKLDCAVIFFNVKHIKLGKLMKNVNGGSSSATIVKHLALKDKMNFTPSDDRKKRIKQLAQLWRVCKKANLPHPVVIIIDESGLMGTVQNGYAMSEIFTTGRNIKVFGWALMQRPAQVSKDVTTQANKKIMFDMDDYEEGYLSDRYAKYYVEALHRARAKGKYHYTVIDGRTILDTYKSNPDKRILRYNT